MDDVCKNGHIRSEENIYIAPEGKRYCIECQRICCRKWKRDNRDKVNIARKNYYKNNADNIQRQNRETLEKRFSKDPDFFKANARKQNKGWEDAPKRCKNWTKEDELFVINSILSIKEIAEKLGRSYKAVSSKRHYYNKA